MCRGRRGAEELGCVIKTLIIQSITDAIIGGRAEDGRGEAGRWDFRSYSEFDSEVGRVERRRDGIFSCVRGGSMARPRGKRREVGGRGGEVPL